MKNRENRSSKLNKEKLQLLFSGAVDPSVPRKLNEFRKKLGVPKGGLKGDAAEEWGENITDELQKKLWEATRYFVKKYDLSKFLRHPVESFILYGYFGLIESGVSITGACYDENNVWVDRKDLLKWTLEIQPHNNPSDDEIFKMIKRLLKRAPISRGLKPSKNINRDILILKESRKKGRRMASPATEEAEEPYSDVDIIKSIAMDKDIKRFKEANTPKAKSRLRVERYRAESRLKKHFPNLKKD